jgi:succinoglycan biosynthesis transport protein ExoP
VQSSPPEDARLGVGRAVRRHLAIVIGLLILVPIAAAVLVLGRTTLYTSSTTVFLRPTIGNALSPDSAKNAQQVTVAMQTEAGLVSAPQVAALVSKKLNTVVEAGSSKVAASVPPNTQIIEIRYTAGEAEAARAGTEAFATAFLTERKAVSDDTVKRQLQLLKDQANVVTSNLKKVSTNAASTNPSPDSAALVQLYTNRLTNLQDLIGQLETTDTNPGSVVTPATTPAGRAPLDSVLVLGAAAILGLLAGISLAVWRERGDDRIRAADDETVGGVPQLARLAGVQAHEGPARERQRLELSNGYRHARASMLIALHERAVVAVAAADTSPAVPAGVIAANLAACLAGGRYNVCVLDVADAASSAPSEAARVLGVTAIPVTLPAEAGHGGPRLDSVPRGHGVGVVTLDTVPVDDPGLFVSSRFLELITGLQAKYDIVIVAAPPLRSAHGTEVCLVADGVMVVVTDRKTTRENVRELVTQQARLRVPVVGLISLQPAHRGGGRAGASYDAIGVTSAEPVPTAVPEVLPVPVPLPVADRARTQDVPSVHRPNGARPVDAERAPVTGLPADGAPKRAKAEPNRTSGIAGVEDETVVLRRTQVNAKINGKPAAGQPDGRGAVPAKGGPVWFDRTESDD